MLESIFIILHHLTTLLFGIFLSASFLGMKRNIKNGGILSVFSIVVSAVYIPINYYCHFHQTGICRLYTKIAGGLTLH